MAKKKSTVKKVKCVVCGETLERTPSHIKPKNYCSKKCWNSTGNQRNFFQVARSN